MTGVINGAAYGLLGVGFALILGVTGRFHFAYSFTYALAAYMVFWWSDRVGVRLLARRPCSASPSPTVVGVGIERFVYRPIAGRAGATALLAIFVASLGIAIAGQNLISLVFSSASQQISSAPAVAAHARSTGGRGSFRWLDVWQVLSAVVLVLDPVARC